MSNECEKALGALRGMGITFELEEHPPVYTIEEMEALGITERGDVCKNLFLRDAKGKNHFLVVLPGDKRADLKSIAAKLETSALSFASESRLKEHLGLEKGAVTPLGIINNDAKTVTLVFDMDLRHKDRLGVHPNVNTATVWLRFSDLLKLAENLSVPVRYI